MGKASTPTSDCLAPSRPTNSLESHKPSSTSIDSLPTELLIEIFALCTGDDAPLAPLVLAQVCRGWRTVIWTTPDAWRRLSLDDTQRPVPASHRQAALWLAHSHPHAFDVRVQLARPDSLLPLLAPVLPHLHRCRTLELAGRTHETIAVAALADDPAQAALHHLIITLKGAAELDDDDGAPRAPTFSAFPPYLAAHAHGGAGAPLLNKLTMRATALELPLAPLMVPVPLRSLAILENSPDVTPDPARLVRFLAFCPQLEELRFSGYPHEPPPPPPHAPRGAAPVARLPRLHTLVLRSTCAVRAILSHLDAPALRELYLEHTNMEFELRHAAHARDADAEPGDSEDEAHDFSQSPWSDLGTGMGLRRLIARSRPPLQVLDMNYADMRTKDFAWCFEHLTHLRDFRIIASDMSDRVIRLLAPYRARAPRYLGAVFGENGEDEEAVRVRLPRLVSLELEKCHRLTGDAVVNAFVARVLHTDTLAEGQRGRTLRQVSIIGCADVQPRHIMALSPILGTRLRTSE
ncbi:hypothetical protein EIP86_007480 [Pleurotus ostreatoroseus]|nr:hypothetical protein EIP86_007480 [Pleurotus ostreatoroseus]